VAARDGKNTSESVVSEKKKEPVSLNKAMELIYREKTEYPTDEYKNAGHTQNR